jgi:hypothetical protein
MKTDFSINVQVNLGVTPELVTLVSAILAHRPQKLEGALDTQGAQLENTPQEQKQQPPQPKEEEAAASQAPTTKRGRKKKDPEPPTDKPKDKPGSEEEEAAANQAEANADGSELQQEEQKPEPPQQQEAAKPLTEEDVRAAMHRTRQRIEGEDYRDNVTGEQYQKYHKPLTAQFKNMAALLGADKPSALPEDQRATFIKQCDELKIMEDGTIGSDCPF